MPVDTAEFCYDYVYMNLQNLYNFEIVKKLVHQPADTFSESPPIIRGRICLSGVDNCKEEKFSINTLEFSAILWMPKLC
jgi:hypothetical protein